MSKTSEEKHRSDNSYRQMIQSLQKKVICKQYFNSRLTVLSLKGSIIFEEMLNRKKIKLLWQIHTKVEKDHKTNLW